MHKENIDVLDTDPRDYVDVYVSTDVSEVAYLLGEHGFTESHRTVQTPLYNAWDVRTNLGYTQCQSPDDMLVECLDISIKEDRYRRLCFGFPTMSKIRVHTAGRIKVTPTLLRIIEALRAERQNIVLVDDRSTLIYREQSDFYC